VGRVLEVRDYGLPAAWAFLHINGVELGDHDVDDAEQFMNDAASRELDIEYIATKLSAYAKKPGTG
jgi:death on curing protein